MSCKSTQMQPCQVSCLWIWPTMSHALHRWQTLINKNWRPAITLWDTRQCTQLTKTIALMRLHNKWNDLSDRCQHYSEWQSEDGCCQRAQSWPLPLLAAAVSAVPGTWSQGTQQRNVALRSQASQWTAGALFAETPTSVPIKTYDMLYTASQM